MEAFRELIERRKRSNKRTVRLRLFPNRYEQETLFDIGLACARLWNELNYEKRSNKRTVRLRLFPNRYEQETLFDIGLACARLWNELNYEKRQAFFNRELSPGKRDEINKKYYHRYKEVLGVNAGQVVNKNDEAWNAFFELLDLRKQGKLPPFMKKLSPPGYWKDRNTVEKSIHILIRNDRYYLEPISEDKGYIVLEDLDLRIRYAGRIRWVGIESLKRTPTL
jgi:putative transposase